MNIFISVVKSCKNHLNCMILELSGSFRREIPECCYALNLNIGNLSPSKTRSPISILDDIIDNGFLWGVPKSRRSLERRMTRRMGFGKMILPKKNIVVCATCGHFHPVHTVCGNCYEKVKKETELMQEAVMKELKLEPIDKEVVVLYENDSKESKTFQGKRIVEVPKERPPWFSRNLLAKDSEIPRGKNHSVTSSHLPTAIQNENK